MSRQAARERLVALFTAEGSFSQVHGHAPVDLEGMTPVLCIYTDRTRHTQASADMKIDLYTYILDVYVKRVAGESAEDILDAQHEVIRVVVKANIADANWSHIHLEDESDAYFAEISGVAYRVERHPLVVKCI